MGCPFQFGRKVKIIYNIFIWLYNIFKKGDKKMDNPLIERLSQIIPKNSLVEQLENKVV